MVSCQNKIIKKRMLSEGHLFSYVFMPAHYPLSFRPYLQAHAAFDSLLWPIKKPACIFITPAYACLSRYSSSITIYILYIVNFKLRFAIANNLKLYTIRILPDNITLCVYRDRHHSRRHNPRLASDQCPVDCSSQPMRIGWLPPPARNNEP